MDSQLLNSSSGNTAEPTQMFMKLILDELKCFREDMKTEILKIGEKLELILEVDEASIMNGSKSESMIKEITNNQGGQLSLNRDSSNNPLPSSSISDKVVFNESHLKSNNVIDLRDFFDDLEVPQLSNSPDSQVTLSPCSLFPRSPDLPRYSPQSPKSTEPDVFSSSSSSSVPMSTKITNPSSVHTKNIKKAASGNAAQPLQPHLTLESPSMVETDLTQQTTIQSNIKKEVEECTDSSDEETTESESVSMSDSEYILSESESTSTCEYNTEDDISVGCSEYTGAGSSKEQHVAYEKNEENSTGNTVPRVLNAHGLLKTPKERRSVKIPDGITLPTTVEEIMSRLKIVPDPETDETLFECPFCKKRGRYRCDMKRHVMIHTGLRPFSCMFCNKAFKRPAHMRCHMRTHTGEKPYKCKQCPKTFRGSSALSNHKLTHIRDEIKKQRNLNIQSKSGHYGTVERPYMCEVCDKFFRQKIHLEVHLKSHTGEKGFECKVCSKPFRRKEHVLRHMRCHTGEKPYECPSCSRRFSDPSSLRKHKISWHT